MPTSIHSLPIQPSDIAQLVDCRDNPSQKKQRKKFLGPVLFGHPALFLLCVAADAFVRPRAQRGFLRRRRSFLHSSR